MRSDYAEDGPILVIGAAGLDIVGRATATLQKGTSNPGKLRMSDGGVARNVAENLARLNLEVQLITAVGDDRAGRRLLAQARQAHVNVDHALCVPEQPTGIYLALLDARGNLHLGLDDMRVIEAITPDYLREKRALFQNARALFVDANVPEKALSTAIRLARQANIPIAADATSMSLAPRFKQHLSHLWVFTPNEAEANVLCPQEIEHAQPDTAIDAARHLVSCGVENAIITMAEFGLGYATASGSGHVPALKTEIRDPTGAGDALTGAVMFALLNDIPIDEAVQLGLAAASLTLRTKGTVVPDLSLERLYDQLS
jgi:pseudouridine kinase